MRDLLQRDSFHVFGSKMASDMGQNAGQGTSKGARKRSEKLDFSQMLSDERMRLAAGQA